MNAEGQLFEVLLESDRTRLIERQLGLMAQSATAAIVAEHWVSVLLAWHLQGGSMDATCVRTLLDALQPDHLLHLENTIFEEFLPAIANGVFGAEVIETTSAPPRRTAPRFERVARAIAFGAVRDEWLPPYAPTARAAGRAIQELDYVRAVHALCCLSVDDDARERHPCRGEVVRFTQDARDFLGWSADTLGNARLRWELHVYDQCVSA